MIKFKHILITETILFILPVVKGKNKINRNVDLV